MTDDAEQLVYDLNDQVATLYQEGRYDEAIELAKQTRDIARRQLGEQSEQYAGSLNNLATLYQAQGRLAGAVPLFERALEIYRAVLGEADPQFVPILNNLGGIYENLGWYSKVEPVYEEAIRIACDAGPEYELDYAHSLNALGLFLYAQMGRYDEAEPLLKEAVKLYSGSGGETDPDYAFSLNNLAGLYEQQGRYRDAKPLYRRALEIMRAARGESHPDVATLLNNLAYLYESTGLYKQAEPVYKQALTIRQAIWGEDHPDVADSMTNLAHLYQALSRYEEAEPLYDQALAIRRSILGPEHSSVAQSLNNLAGLHAAMGRLDDALTKADEAEAIHDRLISEVFSFASERQRLIYAAKLQGNLDAFLSLALLHPDRNKAARAGLNRVLRRKAIGIELLSAQRGAILSGRYPDLEKTLNELIHLQQRIADAILIGPGEQPAAEYQSQLNNWNTKRDRLESELARRMPEVNLNRRLRDVNPQSLSAVMPPESILVEFIRFYRFNFHARGNARWKPARYLAFVLRAGDADGVGMFDLGPATLIDRSITHFRTTIVGGPLSVARSRRIPRYLRRHQAGGRFAGRSRPSLLKGGHSRAARAARASRVVTRFGGTVSSESKSRTRRSARAGLALRKRIVDPVAHLIGGHKRLFLAPDGDLTRLPFEVLPTNHRRRLIDDYEISYFSVGRDLLGLPARATTLPATLPSPALVLADPNFDLGSGEAVPETANTQGAPRPALYLDLHFDPLPGTQREGQDVAGLLGVQPWLLDNVLEAHLKAARSPAILHIASHGFFLDNPPHRPDGDPKGQAHAGAAGPTAGPLLRSGIALAGANGGSLPLEAEDGILTALDVTGLNLLDTELVALSACDTGLGGILPGEGVFGLRRAFVLAGARTLVMSLWKVPDRQTQELMEEFYGRLLTGLQKSDALRQAQLAIKKRYPDPYYWGAFICQGDPTPLSPLAAGARNIRM